MKKKLSLNKLKITAMDANALRGVRGGGEWDGWSTYEEGCTVETYQYNCSMGKDCDTRYIEPRPGCEDYATGQCGVLTVDPIECGPMSLALPECPGETQHVNCPSNGPECGTRTNPCSEMC